MRTADFEYELPDRLIAQAARPRGTSRLLVLDRRSGAARFARVAELPAYLAPGDLMLVNDVRVIPARLPEIERHCATLPSSPAAPRAALDAVYSAKRELGLESVAGPFVRSSFRAQEAFLRVSL